MTSPSHQVHGLAADQVRPDWPALHRTEISQLLQHYPQLGALTAIGWHSPRPLSAAALVSTRAQAVFIKRHHHQVREVSDLAEEHRLIRHLQGHGIPIPGLLANAEGHTATRCGAWTYELSEVAAGADWYRDSPSWQPVRQRGHARAAGKALAQMHLAAADYHAPQRHTHLLLARDELLASPQPVRLLQQQLAQRPGLRHYLAQRDWQDELGQIVARWHDGLPQRLAATPPLWTHNDWHGSNLMWREAQGEPQVSSVLDFGLCARTWACHDLATAIERNAIAWLNLEAGHGAVHADVALELLDGYHQIRSLAAAELRLVRDLLPIVHLDFALSEVDYFTAITRSKADADVAYDTFLIGHAQWFDSPYGKALLQALPA